MDFIETISADDFGQNAPEKPLPKTPADRPLLNRQVNPCWSDRPKNYAN